MVGSTFYNSQFSRGNLISFTTVEGEVVINLFDPLLNKAMSQIKNYQVYSYSEIDKIVNISYQAYGTTSLWWAILLFSGLIHPYEIPSGYVLKIPDLSDLISAVTPIVNKIGQVVTL